MAPITHDHKVLFHALHDSLDLAEEVLQTSSTAPVLPDPSVLQKSASLLHTSLPSFGLGLSATSSHLLQDVAPALSLSSLSPSYYGFVTGGVTPAARVGECLASLYDQNEQVHLPSETLATDTSDAALRMLCELFDLDATVWNGRTFTTGATGANVLGLAIGREYVVAERGFRQRDIREGYVMASVGELGLLEACRRCGVRRIKVLTTMGHSSLIKAASVVGIGRAEVVDVGLHGEPWRFDIEKMENELAESGAVSIVAVSAGEVNTGRFATDGEEDMQRLRAICDRHGAWLHVDAAFGLFARLLDPSDASMQRLRASVRGLELANSIASDGHKLLNVPYDCGFFFYRQPNRHPQLAPAVFQNKAAYLPGGAASADAIPSPLNIRLENSARFRGLPVYSTLIAYGRDGYRDMVTRQVQLARRIAGYMLGNSAFELLPVVSSGGKALAVEEVFMIVLFRARDRGLNESLAKTINETREMYVSSTKWENAPAYRIAVANWQVDVERDFKRAKQVLDRISLKGNTSRG